MLKRTIIVFFTIASSVMGCMLILNWQPAFAQDPVQRITANLTKNRVEGHDWPVGKDVILTIGDPADPDFTDVQSPTSQNYTNFGEVQFELGDDFILEPGQLVTLTNEETTTQHVVLDFLPIDFNIENETVSGSAQPGSQLRVSMHWIDGMVERNVAVDQDGYWEADFSDPVGGETMNLTQWSFGYIYQDAENMNETMRVIPIVFETWPGPFGGQKIWCVNWKIGKLVNVKIYTPGNMEEPVYSSTIIPGEGPGASTGGILDIDPLDEIDILPGQVVKLTQVEIQKALTVSALRITEADYLQETVSGTASPGAEVMVTVELGAGEDARRFDVADDEGNWQVYFSNVGVPPYEGQDPFDLQVGMYVSAHESDQDADVTGVLYQIRPIITGIQAPDNPMEVNALVEVTATFLDSGLGGPYTATWYWEDGSTPSLGGVEDGIVTGSHTYLRAGVYPLGLKLCVDNSVCGTASYQYIVIYDPSEGFVTGGGWINSPEGAYLPDPTLSGPAHFGFVSKYKRGASKPTGSTEFQFQVADLNFHSSLYQWLVIAGSKAIFKGTGTINQTGVYGFIISAVDGNPDSFRIKIWDKTSDEMIYDNQNDTVKDVDAAAHVVSGSIMIHKAK